MGDSQKKVGSVYLLARRGHSPEPSRAKVIPEWWQSEEEAEARRQRISAPWRDEYRVIRATFTIPRDAPRGDEVESYGFRWRQTRHELPDRVIPFEEFDALPEDEREIARQAFNHSVSVIGWLSGPTIAHPEATHHHWQQGWFDFERGVFIAEFSGSCEEFASESVPFWSYIRPPEEASWRAVLAKVPDVPPVEGDEL
jgi:hypothetical protein